MRRRHVPSGQATPSTADTLATPPANDTSGGRDESGSDGPEEGSQRAEDGNSSGGQISPALSLNGDSLGGRISPTPSLNGDSLGRRISPTPSFNGDSLGRRISPTLSLNGDSLISSFNSDVSPQMADSEMPSSGNHGEVEDGTPPPNICLQEVDNGSPRTSSFEETNIGAPW